jgi:streptomycin 3"-adenylyltransferase
MKTATLSSVNKINIEGIPKTVDLLLDEVVRSFRNLLGDDLVELCVHGSIAMGCFNPESSDIDLLVVVRGSLPLAAKRAIVDMMLTLSLKAPKKGFEMSVVAQDSLWRFMHPTPYEVHFSNAIAESYRKGEVDLLARATDKDLAAHFTVARARGVSLYGPPCANIFPAVPSEYYLDSIIGDTRDSLNNIEAGQNEGECEVPVYAVLNAGRVLAYASDGLITSKAEGGVWAARKLPGEYRPIIEAALDKYQGQVTSVMVNAHNLKLFGHYISRRLDELGAGIN